MHAHAGRLAATEAADRLQAVAQTLVVAVVERFGTTFDPARAAGPGGSDPAPAFATGTFRDALASHGYLLPPAGSAWAEVWAAHASVKASSRVIESQEDLYLQSQNRATRIDSQFALTRKGQPLWQVRVFAQTRSPIPDLPAYIAGKLATAGHRDAEIERRLRDDARTAWLLQAARNFQGIPIPAGAAPVPPPAAGARAEGGRNKTS